MNQSFDDPEEESSDSKSDLMTSALAMLALGAIILAVGAWCAVGFGGLMDGTGNSGSGTRYGRGGSGLAFLFLGGGTLLGIGSGLWLAFSGLRVIFKLMLGKKNFD